MSKERKGMFLFLFLFIPFYSLLFLLGCSTDWERKFVRKRVKPPRPAQFQIEQASRPFPELYREHFNYWKSWHKQLIEDLGSNHKRERQDYEEARRHLEAMAKYVSEEKAVEASKLVVRFDGITTPIRRSHVSEGDYGILERRLESIRSEIESKLHPKKMKGFFLATPIPIRMEEYEGEEPLLPSVKPLAAPADSLSHGNDIIPYEKYRTLSNPPSSDAS